MFFWLLRGAAFSAGWPSETGGDRSDCPVGGHPRDDGDGLPVRGLSDVPDDAGGIPQVSGTVPDIG